MRASRGLPPVSVETIILRIYPTPIATPLLRIFVRKNREITGYRSNRLDVGAQKHPHLARAPVRQPALNGLIVDLFRFHGPV